VLWKPSKANEPGWPSPGGIAALGRPGWHIECSAMSMATLIEPFGGGLECDDPSMNVFDIHGGGIDLVFPHHENEIAQSCSAFGSSRMANVWIHNGFLQVESEKMSKSLGNFWTIRELLETRMFGQQMWPGEVLRLAMLGTHYRQPIDFTQNALEEARHKLNVWYHAIDDDVVPSREPTADVINALCDDLNTHEAIRYLDQLAGAIRAVRSFNREPPSEAVGDLKAGANLLGLLQRNRSEYIKSLKIDAAEIDRLVARRATARAAKNWSESDRLRDELSDLGVEIKDNKDGTTTWEPKR
jgi:cysteinyl-tRNA synthetase